MILFYGGFVMLNNETLKTIKQRRSIRSFEDKQISDEELNTIIETGIYAPNGSGNIEEFIHFAVIQNKEILNKINNLSKEFAVQVQIPDLAGLGNNKEFNCLYGAQTLIIISYSTNWVQPETDCAAATQNMLLAAESIGVGGCWLYFPLMAFNTSCGNDLFKELKIPAGYKPYQSIILGYKNDDSITIPKRKIKNISYIK
jgi:nitroreductase